MEDQRFKDLVAALDRGDGQSTIAAARELGESEESRAVEALSRHLQVRYSATLSAAVAEALASSVAGRRELVRLLEDPGAGPYAEGALRRSGSTDLEVIEAASRRRVAMAKLPAKPSILLAVGVAFVAAFLGVSQMAHHVYTDRGSAAEESYVDRSFSGDLWIWGPALLGGAGAGASTYFAARRRYQERQQKLAAGESPEQVVHELELEEEQDRADDA